MKSPYDNQVLLLLDVLPIINDFDDFALKGGTAINLFYRDMPRRSVDIDLIYLPLTEREKTLLHIASLLETLSEKMRTQLANVTVEPIQSSGILKGHQLTIKLDVYREGMRIRIEPNLILRGSVYQPSTRDLCAKAQQVFQRYTTAQCASFEDMFAGKMCAALDRQHPRDFFDVHLLMRNEGITPPLVEAFIVYLCGHNRPISEILNPNFNKDFHETYETEFEGMATDPVSAEELIASFEDFKKELKSKLTANERKFILDFSRGVPNWDLIPNISHVKEFPSIRWKLLNIEKMSEKKKLKEHKLIQTLFD